MSLICFAVGAFACLIFKNKARSSPKTAESPCLDNDAKSKIVDEKSSRFNIDEMFDFSIVKNWKFLLWCVIDILLEGAYNIPYYFLPCKLSYVSLKIYAHQANYFLLLLITKTSLCDTLWFDVSSRCNNLICRFRHERFWTNSIWVIIS